MKKVLYGVLFLIVILLAVLNREILIDPERLRAAIAEQGWRAPLFVIFVVFLEGLLAPLPGAIVPFLAGGILGAPLAIVSVWVGDVLAALFAFELARTFGGKWLEKHVSRWKLERYRKLLESHAHSLWLFYAIFPVDILNFLLGLSLISMRRFLFLVSTALLFQITLLAMAGDQAASVLIRGRPDFFKLAFVGILATFLAIGFWWIKKSARP